MPRTAEPPVELAPAEAGFDAGRLARLDAYLDECVERDPRKGSLIALARRGRLFHVSWRGHRDAEAGLAVEPDTLWRIYSMTKPIAAVAVLLLAEDGALSLTDPLERFLPAFARPRVYVAGQARAPVTVPARGPIRIWHLLTHTAGHTSGHMAQNPVDQAATLSAFGRPPGTPVASLDGRGFGLGVAPRVDPVGVESLSSRGEYGWGGAAGTDFWVDPETELTAVFVMQAVPPPDAVWLNLRRLVYQALVDRRSWR